jgi:hypothetical protein
MHSCVFSSIAHFPFFKTIVVREALMKQMGGMEGMGGDAPYDGDEGDDDDDLDELPDLEES